MDVINSCTTAITVM